MFNFLKKIWAAAKSADKKTIAGILALSAVLFFAPNISNAALIDIGYTLIAKVAFGISWVIALLGGLIVGVIIIALQMILTVSNGIVNSSPVQIGFPIVLSVANLGFVTAIIFIAIGTILRSQTYNMKKMLANVVIMAVLVNFGLVISGAIIGFSNRVTTYFLDSMTGGNVADFATIMAQTMNPQQAFPDMKAPSITGTKVDAATTTIPKEDTDALAALGKNASNDDTKSIGSFLIPIISIFLTIATLVLMIVTLATLVFSFIMRYIKLTFALILLPGAWMASVFPSLKKWNSKWWDLFIKQAIYPPVVLFFLWLAMRVQADMAALPGLNFEDLSKMKGVSGFLGNLVGVPLQGVLQSAVLAGLMLGGDYIANSMGAAGAGAALKASGDMQKWAGKKVGSGARRVGRTAQSAVASTKPAGALATKLQSSRLLNVATLGVAGAAGRGMEQMRRASQKNLAEHQKEVAGYDATQVRNELQTATGDRLIALLEQAKKTGVINDALYEVDASGKPVKDAAGQPVQNERIMRRLGNLSNQQKVKLMQNANAGGYVDDVLGNKELSSQMITDETQDMFNRLAARDIYNKALNSTGLGMIKDMNANPGVRAARLRSTDPAAIAKVYDKGHLAKYAHLIATRGGDTQLQQNASADMVGKDGLSVSNYTKVVQEIADNKNISAFSTVNKASTATLANMSADRPDIHAWINGNGAQRMGVGPGLYN